MTPLECLCKAFLAACLNAARSRCCSEAGPFYAAQNPRVSVLEVSVSRRELSSVGSSPGSVGAHRTPRGTGRHSPYLARSPSVAAAADPRRPGRPAAAAGESRQAADDRPERPRRLDRALHARRPLSARDQRRRRAGARWTSRARRPRRRVAEPEQEEGAVAEPEQPVGCATARAPPGSTPRTGSATTRRRACGSASR